MIFELLALAAAQAAAPIDEARFRACAAQARSAPEQAVETANAWLVQGGGFEARQCLGLAYAGQQRWEPAATVFGQAADEAEQLRLPAAADFRVQAGNAWLAAGEATRAVEAFDAALATTHLADELRGEVHLDRARALVALGNEAGAREDLDRGIALVPADPFGWYLSAALARRADDLERAKADIGRAVELAPDDPDVLLLAGTVAGLAGDLDETRRLYRRVTEIAPDTPAGRSARESLMAHTAAEAMDAAAPEAGADVTEGPADGAPPADPPQSR